jgi:hypothetical protein
MIPRPLGSKFAGDIVIGGGYAKAKDGGTLEFGTTNDSTLNIEAHDWLIQTTPLHFGSSWGTDHPDGRTREAWNHGCKYPTRTYLLILTQYRILRRRFPIGWRSPT